MAELVFVKLGGSLITDKMRESRARPELIARLGEEMAHALAAREDLKLLIGHGSGSFGHVAAQRYHVQTGCSDWQGYAETSAAALRLNRIVADQLLRAGLPVVTIQPSASARASAGQLQHMDCFPIQEVLQHNLIPLVFGDVALDKEWGTTIISTESIFAHLAAVMHPQRIILVGEVAGVFSGDPHLDPAAQLIPVIQAGRSKLWDHALGGSNAIDVTGGMRSKVQEMARLVRCVPGLRVLLLGGLQEGLLERSLTDPASNPGTLIQDK